MAWYRDLLNKLNPAQEEIVVSVSGSGPISTREPFTNYTAYYEYLEVVNRGVNMIVDDTAQIPLVVGDSIKGLKPIVKGIRGSRVDLLLNTEPNPFQDISSFRRNLIIDYILDGNIFIYFDGHALYHQPASFMTIVPDEKSYIKEYRFNDNIKFGVDEIIHIKDNSFKSIYRGTSRLRAAQRIMSQLTKMRDFQDNFFENGAVPGLVIKTPSTISEKNKERMIQSWITRYNPNGGGRRPLILDGGMDLASITNVNFKELDFETSIVSAEKEILKVLGIPPILLDSGNNANIRPNHRLYYLETVLPIINKITAGAERFFGYAIKEDITNIPALQPEMAEAATYYTTLKNAGIITGNEARQELNFCEHPDCDEIVVPQNIAGSATDSSQGGRPTEGDPDDSE